MNFDKLKGSNNFLIWVILVIIAVGFGKCGDSLGVNLFKIDNCHDDKHSRKHCKTNVCYTNPVGGRSLGPGGLNSFFGGNGLFILLVIGLLFLCKDNNSCDNAAVSIDEEIIQSN